MESIILVLVVANVAVSVIALVSVSVTYLKPPAIAHPFPARNRTLLGEQLIPVSITLVGRSLASLYGTHLLPAFQNGISMPEL